MKFLLIPGSLRKESFNKKLLLIAGEQLRKIGAEIDVVLQNDINFPIYNADIEAVAIPEPVYNLGKRISACDGIVVVSPEYNGSISSPLKSVIDWISRLKPVPLKGKPLLLLAASPGILGGVRGLWHGRVPFEVLGALVFPDMMGLQKADTAFDESGSLKDAKIQERLVNLLTQFSSFTQKNKVA